MLVRGSLWPAKGSVEAHGKKFLKIVGKVARAGLGLAKAFGTPEQQAKAQQAEQAYEIVQGAGCKGATAKKPSTRLRKMMV